MPVMDIAPMTSDLLLQRLESYLFYPEDESKRNAYYYVNKHKSYQDGVEGNATEEAQQLVPLEEMRVLVHAKSYGTINKEGNKRYEECRCVGLILVFHLYMNHTLHEKTPSVRKCIQHLARTGADFPDNSLPTTEPSFWNYWKRYKSVRHLCAGRVLVDMLLEDGKIGGAKETMGSWLSLSDSLLKYGAGYSEPTTGQPLIQKNCTWTFPDWLNFSPVDVTVMPMNFPFFDVFLQNYTCQDYLIIER